MLALLVYQPPVRTSFYSSCIISDGKKIDDKKYLVIQKTKQFTTDFYDVGKEKVTERRAYKGILGLKAIEIADKNLIDIKHFQ